MTAPTDRLVATGKTPEPKPQDPGYHPDPPVLSFKAFGIAVEFDEDYVIVAGHHTVRRFVAAANRVARVDLGLSNLWDDRSATYADVVEGIRSVWAVRLIKCTCTPERCCDDLHDRDPDPEAWWITWSRNGVPFDRDTHGARPYMIGSW